MSLLAFHRLLIAAGILFCAGFAFLEGRGALRGDGSPLLAITFLLFAAGLALYLTRMRRVLGYGDEPDGSEPGAAPR